MGDPRRQRTKYARPTHLWRPARIEEENELISKYGLKNKKEIWQAKAAIGRIRHQAITLQALSGEEAQREKNELIERLLKIGLIKANTLESILALTVEDMLERRLQTIVYRKGIAQSPGQARQFISHGKVVVGENIVTVPKYQVSLIEEDQIRLKEGFKVPEVGKKQPAAESEVKEKESSEGVSVGQEA